MDQQSSQQNYYMLPVAIIIAAIFISGAIFYSRGGFNFFNLAKTDTGGQNYGIGSNSLDMIRPVGADDHIFGNADAPVKIIEYSDFECPFCKDFHKTMKQITDEYEDSGKVAWVYRHFPIDELHPVKARKEAIASECAAELGNPRTQRAEQSPYDDNPRTQRAEPRLGKSLAGLLFVSQSL